MSATLKSEIPGGAIQSQRVDQDFADYIAGRSLTQRLVIGVLQPNSVSMENQTKGRVNKVKYEILHLVEVRDPHEIDQLRHRITQLRADAGLEVSQPALFGLTDAEQCEELIDQIKEWASAKDIPISELDTRFYSYFGGDDAAGLAKTVQSCRSPLQLKEFAYEIGAIPDPKPLDLDEDGTKGEGAPAVPAQKATGKKAGGPEAAGSVPFTEVIDK